MKNFFLSLILFSSCALNIHEVHPSTKNTKDSFSNARILSIASPNDLAPDFWLNGGDSSKFTGCSNCRSNKIISFATSDVNAYSLTPLATIDIPSFNGEAIYSNTIGGLTLSNTNGALDGIHNGGNFTIYFNFKDVNGKGVISGTLATTNNNTASQIGFWLGYTGTKITFKVSNGTSFVVNQTSTAVWAYNQYQWGKIVYDGVNYKMYINGNLVKTTAKVTTLSNSTASSDLKLFATAQYQNGLPAWTKNVIIFQRLLTSTEQSDMDTWIAGQTQTHWNGYANVYFKWGQSNQVGEGNNSLIASELNGKVPAMMYGGYTYSNADRWGQLELGVNQTPENVTTWHGMEMRFGYEMGANTWIIKVAKDGRPLTKITGVDWNVASTQEMFTKLCFNAGKALQDIEGEFNMTPVIRGIDGMQGEGDANTTTSGYDQGKYWYSRYQDMTKGFIDYITTYAGYTHKGGWSVDQMNMGVFRIKDGAPNLNATEVNNVQTCQDSVAIYGFKKYPTYNSMVKSFTTLSTDDIPRNADSLHYNTIGLDSMGMRLSRYMKAHE